MDLAQQISIFGGSQDAELEAMRGERVADSIEKDPRFAKVAADPAQGVEAANGSGSFEALMAGWGTSTGGAPALVASGGEVSSPGTE